MAHQEKRAWILLVVSVISYAAYVIIIAGRADGRPLASVPYAATLLWTVGAAIVASVIGEILFAIARPGASRATDIRDRQIGRIGDYTGQSFVIIGAVAAMLMAMARWDGFWIANVVYLGFALSAVVGSVARIALYRRGVPQW